MAKKFNIEIRNTPTDQTIKVFVENGNDISGVKQLLETLDCTIIAEVSISVARNRVPKNITIFIRESCNINDVVQKVRNSLENYFKTQEEIVS